MNDSLTGLKEKILKEVTIYPKKGIKVVIPKKESGWKEDQVFSSDNLQEKLKAVCIGQEKILIDGKMVLSDKWLLKDMHKALSKIYLEGELGYQNAVKILNSICQKILEGSRAEDGRKVCNIRALNVEDVNELLGVNRGNGTINYSYYSKTDLKISKEIEDLIFLVKSYWLAYRSSVGVYHMSNDGLDSGVLFYAGECWDCRGVRPVFHLNVNVEEDSIEQILESFAKIELKREEILKQIEEEKVKIESKVKELKEEQDKLSVIYSKLLELEKKLK